MAVKTESDKTETLAGGAGEKEKEEGTNSKRNTVRSSVNSELRKDNETDSELAVIDDASKDESSDDGFADAQETASPPAPRRRSLTRMSHSTVSSVPEPSERAFSPDNRVSQASITPATTANGSIQENGIGQAKSPLLNRPISTTSLDEVSLIDELPSTKDSSAGTAPTAPAASASVEPASPPPQPTPSATSLVETLANRFSRGSSSSNVSKPTPAPRKLSSPFLPSPNPLQPTPANATPPEKPAPRRSPFSFWRTSTSSASVPANNNNNNNDTAKRRATASSTSSSGDASAPTNNEPLITRDPEKEKEDLQKGMDNLRENFKKLREAREQGVAVEGGASDSAEGREADATGSTDGPDGTATPEKTEEIDWDLWQAVVDNADNVAAEKPAELNKAIQAGIPPTLRGTVWQSMATSKSFDLEAVYREVIALPGTATAEDARPIFGPHWLWDPSPVSSQASSPRLNSMSTPTVDPRANGNPFNGGAQWGKTIANLEKTIKKDLGDRTSFGRYKVDQKALLNVCKAYALFDPAVGYTQGMTFIATVLLLNMTEEEAFCLFVKLMNKYKLRSMFQEKMKGLELRLYQFDRILEDYDARLAVHLKRQHIESSLYAAQWFLTLFTYKFPLQLVLRVFDLLFSEGLEGPILKFGIALMRRNSVALLDLEFDTLGPFLKEKLFDVYIDATPSANSVMEAGFFGNGGEKEVYRANELVSDACSIKISQEVLERYEREWEEQERVRRETESDLEQLKRGNAHLQNKVKKLEEQNEELNREYVRIASSEVALKVQNDQLQDENEVLKAKVEGLRDIVDKQPQEVEDRLKGEMETLMQKNLQVHSENQSLEESMIEMEKELVSTKMQLATVNEDYDLLKNRWSDLRKALGD